MIKTRLTRFNQLTESGETKKGRWELTSGHEVQYRLDKKDEEFKFKGPIISAKPHALVIAFTGRQSDQKIVTRIAELSGAWRLDPKNRIVFEAEREGGQKDVLTFKNSWQIGPSNEIIYTYRQADTRTKRKLNRELIFSGFWDISKDQRLTYLLGGGPESAFRFRGAFQTQSILAKKGQIRYQAGVEVNGKPKGREIILFGKWKLSRDLGLSFEIEYENGRKKAIRFGGEYALGPKTQIAASLKSREGEPLGVEVLLTRDFFGKDGQAFARLARSLEESKVEAGLRFRW